jgi:hypothetical protein
MNGGKHASSSDHGSESKYGNYVRSALNLRESIVRNRADTEFADTDDHEIVYIFDANVFIFHADLDERMSFMRDVQDLLGEDETGALITVMERLTASFLFSGALPGQIQPAYITVPHFGEVLGRVERIGRELARSPELARAHSVAAQSREQITNVLHDQLLSPTKKLDILSDIVPSWLISTLSRSAHYTRTLRSAFIDGEGSVVPLDRREWGIDAAHAAADEIESWMKVLPRAAAGRSENVRDDAITLQTIVNLYRANSNSASAGRRLYLFVTSDDTLAKAVGQRSAELRAEGIPDFIRLPRDYLPLLNLDAMTHAFGGEHADTALRESFMRVFDALDSALDWVTLPGKILPPSKVQRAEPLSDLRSAWTSASRYATILNAPRLADSAGSTLDELNIFLTSASAAAANLVEVSLIEVRERHVGLLIDGALQDLVSVRGRSGASSHRRVVIQLLGDVFGELVPKGVSINDFLDDTIQSGQLPDETFSALTAAPSSFEAQMLACTMLVAAERWIPATQFGSRAVELADTMSIRGSARTEAAYLLALCLRYSMRSGAQFRRAQSLLLSNNKIYSSRDTSGSFFLRRLRDDMELGTLLMTAAVNQELSRTPRANPLAGGLGRLALLDDALLPTVFRSGAELLSNAREELQGALPLGSDFKGGAADQAQQLAKWIDVFSATNLVGAFVLERVVPGLQMGRPAVPFIIQEMSDIAELIAVGGQEARPLQAIYFWAARILESRIPHERNEAVVELNKLLANTNTYDQRPVADRLEINYLRSWLKEEHAV